MKKKLVFCPYCGTEFIKKTENRKRRLFCPNCDEFFYENPTPGVVAILPEESTDRILLIKRKIIPRSGYWALPGGFIDKNEDAQVAISREILEETGLQTKAVVLMETVHSKSLIYGHLLLVCFIINDYEGNLQAGDDASEAYFFDINRLPSLAFRAHRKLINIYKFRKKSQNLP